MSVVTTPRAAALLLVASHSAIAAETVTTVPPVVVSATRTAQTVDETLASVSVITREDIERQQADSVEDVLRGLPGVSIAENGGPGQLATLFLRGTESDHVLVLVDGVRVGAASNGLYQFNHLPVEQIERIELVRGPRASLYGSDAIGGVLHIITRRGGGELRPHASATVGSRNTYGTSAGVSGGGDRGWFSLNASGESTNGFDTCRGALAGCFANEPDADGYRNRSLAARGGYRFDSGLEVDAHALRTTVDLEFDGGFQNETDARQGIYGGKLAYAPLDDWQTSLAYGHSIDESDNFLNGAFVSEFVTRRDTLSWQNDIAVGDFGLVTVGIDHQRDRLDSTLAFARTRRHDTGYFVQYLGYYGDHDVQLAFRHDDNSQFGAANTGSVAWGWQFAPETRFFASYGTAFRAPNFNELFFPGFGNPNLTPEESSTVEVGLRGTAGGMGWSVTAFRTEVDDLIPAFPAININKARINGLETALEGRVLGVDLRGSFTLLDPRDRSLPSTNPLVPNTRGNQLPRRPRQVFRLDLDRRFGDYSVGGTLRAEGARYDDVRNNVRVGGFGTVDLRAAWYVDEAWTLQAKVENLLDKRYETADNFNQPDRGLFFTVRYQP